MSTVSKAEEASKGSKGDEKSVKEVMGELRAAAAATLTLNEREKSNQEAREETEKKKKSGSFNFNEDKSPWVSFDGGFMGSIRFNPLVSLSAVIIIWSFVVICSVFGQSLPFSSWRSTVVKNFTWLYIGSTNIWIALLLVLYFSKYSELTLGKPDEKPEFSNTTWFMMLFACGMGTALFFFGVAEPVFHYIGPNRFTADPYISDNTLAQLAVNVTFFHWGIHAWIAYATVGLVLALLSFRENLPLTIKSCFYPLIGERIFGWMGDLIDVVSIISTLFGVCTSLGLGTKQLNTGLALIFPAIPNTLNTQVILIWCITAVATASVVSGVGMGIRRISETCFVVGMFLMIVTFVLDDTFFLLNLFTQSFGFYLQNLLNIGFHTDAFEQLGQEAQGGFRDRNRFVPNGLKHTYGPDDWMDSWTMFYLGWWISWSPFVGMFIAKISRGRTIRQFINGTMTAPVLYSFAWLAIFGGAGLKLEREAAANHLCCPDDTGPLKDFNSLAIRVQQEGLDADHALIVLDQAVNFACKDDDQCGKCAITLLKHRADNNVSWTSLLKEYETMGEEFGVMSADHRYTRLSCRITEQMWFDVMRTLGDVGNFMSLVSLLGIILYFVTSSDSGSLVIDCLASNGDPEPPKVQRIFWALTEGATATALLVAGGEQGLLTLQTAGILSGLPYTVVISFLWLSIFRAVRVAWGDLNLEAADFSIGILDPWFALPYKEVWRRRAFFSKLFSSFLLNLVAGPFTLGKIAARVYGGRKHAMVFTLPMALVFYSSLMLFVLSTLVSGLWAIGIFSYCVFALIVAAVRMRVREVFDIDGNPVQDLLLSLVLFSNAIVQMECMLEANSERLEDTTFTMEGVDKNDDNENGDCSNFNRAFTVNEQ